jgi:hypothetical protein
LARTTGETVSLKKPPRERNWHLFNVRKDASLFDNPRFTHDNAQSEFLAAIDKWRNVHGGRLPTMLDAFRIALSLGYRKEPAPCPPSASDAASGGSTPPATSDCSEPSSDPI